MKKTIRIPTTIGKLQLSIIVTGLCLIVSNLFSQNMYVHLTNESVESYALANIRSITYTAGVMNINDFSGSSTFLDLNEIDFWTYESLITNVAANTVATSLSVYPNPTRESVTIEYRTAKAEVVNIQIVDVNGNFVCNLVNNFQMAGKQQLKWEGLTDAGEQVSSGLYICRIAVGHNIIAKSIMISR